jgi:hypothetical protein
MAVNPAPVLFAILIVVLAPFAIFWLVKPVNYENVWLERFLALYGCFLLLFFLLSVASLTP